jgi:hypothetical protein
VPAADLLSVDFVTIAPCTTRLRQADAANTGVFHDAKPSNMLSLRRFW